jgi:hypothetical protein
MVYGYTDSDVIAELRGWNETSGDNDVVCVLWIYVVVGTESYDRMYATSSLNYGGPPPYRGLYRYGRNRAWWRGVRWKTRWNLIRICTNN